MVQKKTELSKKTNFKLLKKIWSTIVSNMNKETKPYITVEAFNFREDFDD